MCNYWKSIIMYQFIHSSIKFHGNVHSTSKYKIQSLFFTFSNSSLIFCKFWIFSSMSSLNECLLNELSFWFLKKDFLKIIFINKIETKEWLYEGQGTSVSLKQTNLNFVVLLFTYNLISHLSARLLSLSSTLLGGGSGDAGLMGLRQGAGAGLSAVVGAGDTGETEAWPDPLLWTAKSSG